MVRLKKHNKQTKRRVVFICSAVLMSTFAWIWLHPQQALNLWLTADQQGRIHFERQDYTKAAMRFENKEWKARSFYLAGDFAASAALYQEIKGDEAQLALANALAQSGQYEQAITEYSSLLEHEQFGGAAEYNLQLTQKVLQEHKDAPPSESKSFVIDKNNNKEGVEEDKLKKEQVSSEALWLGQVRQNPNKFLRQKFQQEYANEQD